MIPTELQIFCMCLLVLDAIVFYAVNTLTLISSCLCVCDVALDFLSEDEVYHLVNMLNLPLSASVSY